MKRKYVRLQNPFLVKGKRNFKTMATQSTHNYDALCTNDDIPEVAELKGLTDAVYQTYHTQYDQWNSSHGVSAGGTQNFNDLYAFAPEKIRNWQYKIISVFTEKSTEYKTIFPKGRTDIYKGTQEQQLSKLRAMAMLVKAYPGLATIYDEINIYNKSLDVSYKAKGIKQDAKVKSSVALDKAYDAMGKMLFSNMLQLTDLYIDDTKVVENYFDLSLLRYPLKDSDTGTAYTLLIPANNQKAANISFTANDSFLFSNTSAIPLYYYGAATADAAVPTTLKEILPDEEVEVTAVSLGAPANKFLLFLNKDSQIEGEVEIVLI